MRFKIYRCPSGKEKEKLDSKLFIEEIGEPIINHTVLFNYFNLVKMKKEKFDSENFNQ